MITVTGLHKGFGARDLFRGADLQVFARDRVAVVGPNGSGKTTLFEMIAGDQAPDSGMIRVPSDAVIGFLRQDPDDLRGRPLLDEVLSAGAEATSAAHRLEILEHEMAETEPGPERDRLLAEYGHVQDRFQALGGYSLEAEAKRILAGLAFSEDDFMRPTETFSGGWLMRIALAKLLVASPDILMLDEPTNHLDLESVEWLERFLSAYEGAVLLISHDRDFIDGIATKVVEIEDRKLVMYQGNFEAFVAQRSLRAEQQASAAKHQARRVAATEAFIHRFRYNARKARQVQSRIKALERMERVDAGKRSPKKMALRFPRPPRPGRVVIELQDLSFGYGGTQVYDSLDFAVERDQKVALVGPNGAGKSTLLKLLAGVLEPQAGARRLGHNVALGYFAQHQIEALNPSNTVLAELQSAIPSAVEVKPRDLLGRFLFSGDDVDKPVAVLSGGEQTRLALAKLLVQPLNFLCLDEPTNHLDMMSRDVLEDALIEYSGSLVLITHDRHLIRSVADQIVEVVAGAVATYAGGYDYYLSKRDPRPAPDAVPAPSAAPKSSRKDERRAGAETRARLGGLKRKIATIEAEIEAAAAELTRISATLANPESYSSGADVASLSREYERVRRRAQKLERQWEDAAAQLEAAEAG